MIDLSKYEKIDGREALRRWADGEKVMRETGSPYFINEEGRFVCDNAAIYRPHVTDLTLNEILKECDWYILKPFDVRKTLVKNPNKWVAAYLSQECPHWFKIGFDLQAMSVCTLPLKENGDVGSKYVDYPDDVSLEGILDICIDLGDVPLEATL